MRRGSRLIGEAAWCALLLTLFVPAVRDHVAAQSRRQARRLRKPSPTCGNVKPDISGKRNGVFPEPEAMDFADHAGYVSLFDGKTLTGWDGRPGVWSVEDGAIIGVSTKEKNAGNTFLVYHGVEARDFDLKLEIKVEWGGGSGVQYRSSTGIPPGRTAGPGEPPLDPRWVMIGPQADFWYPLNENDEAVQRAALLAEHVARHRGVARSGGGVASRASRRDWWGRSATARNWAPM